MSFKEMRERANRLRALPLEAVLLRWGATRDRADKAKWHTGRGVISVTGAKFMNWNRSVGGGGAIDLAMHLGDLRFLEAIDWLARNFPAHDPSDPPQVPPRPLLLPFPHEEKLLEVRRYLYDRRRLPEALVEPLIAGGSVYADWRGIVHVGAAGEGGFNSPLPLPPSRRWPGVLAGRSRGWWWLVATLWRIFARRESVGVHVGAAIERPWWFWC